MGFSLTTSFFQNIDMSRIGGTFRDSLRSGNFPYTAEQLRDRALIIGCMAIGYYLGNTLNDPEITQCSNGFIAVAGATLGLLISRSVVAYPTLKRRQAIRELNEEKINSIKIKMNESEEINNPVFSEKIQKILQLIEKHAESRLSISLLTQTKLLTQLNEHLEHFDRDAWDKNTPETLFKLLFSPREESRALLKKSL